MEIEDIKLQNFWGFYDAWFKELGTNCTHREAYDRVESRYEALFKKTRFASFESFLATKYFYIKKDGRR